MEIDRPTEIHRRVENLKLGLYKPFIMRMPSGWAVLGDPQITRGYCLLYPDPVVPHLNCLPKNMRNIFLNDMTIIGDAILKIFNCARINYEILGNLEPALHAHIIPRYHDEPEELKAKPIWFYDWSKAASFSMDIHGSLLGDIRTEITNNLHNISSTDFLAP